MRKKISQREARRMQQRIRELEASQRDRDQIVESHSLGRWQIINATLHQAIKTATQLDFRIEVSSDFTEVITLYGVRRTK